MNLLIDWTRKRSNSAGDSSCSECCLGFMGASGGKGEKQTLGRQILLYAINLNKYYKNERVWDIIKGHNEYVLQPLWKLLVDMVSINHLLGAYMNVIKMQKRAILLKVGMKQILRLIKQNEQKLFIRWLYIRL